MNLNMFWIQINLRRNKLLGTPSQALRPVSLRSTRRTSCVLWPRPKDFEMLEHPKGVPKMGQTWRVFVYFYFLILFFPFKMVELWDFLNFLDSDIVFCFGVWSLVKNMGGSQNCHVHNITTPSSRGFQQPLAEARTEFPQWVVGTDIDGRLPVTLEMDPKSKARDGDWWLMLDVSLMILDILMFFSLI